MLTTLENDYALVISQSLIWGDMDAYQHINNTVYFRYFEDIRMAYFEKIGVNAHMEQHNQAPILARTECDFRSPLIYPDQIVIATNCQPLSEKKFNMDYVIYSEQQDRLVAEGSGLGVYYDFNEHKSCKIPADIVARMKAPIGRE